MRLLLCAALVALLSGCVAEYSDHGYRGGYYGRAGYSGHTGYYDRGGHYHYYDHDRDHDRDWR